ncbi:hypothetical protein SYK_00830 [Pseudodesulfovibrio nedwellii]|uniref:Uncharacterized protein n=1 Tax=Pseudodesulfovibrio nedwellii TaxID=2973072 RepID=A0ABN6S0E2_9BACT|nr:hypothetical protein SYK_00830 [Pseudodesulfovibrio nedwellii]
MVNQDFCDFFGGRSHIDKERRSGGDVLGNQFGDDLFFPKAENFAIRVVDVFCAEYGAGPPMVSLKESLIAESIDISTDSLRGDIELGGQVSNGNKASFSDKVDNLFVAYLDGGVFAAFGCGIA